MANHWTNLFFIGFWIGELREGCSLSYINNVDPPPKAILIKIGVTVYSARKWLSVENIEDDTKYFFCLLISPLMMESTYY